jgi:5'(3')-deoxyribonucleotidase
MIITEITSPQGRSKIYLDMDGVLADFFAEYAQLAGLPPGSSYREIPPAKADPTLNKMVGTDFFYRLPKLPNADNIVKIATKLFGHYNICSSPLRGDHENSREQKTRWIKKHLSPQPRDIIITPRKETYAVQPDGTPNILIDDRKDNIIKWESAGGIGIKYQADEDDLDVILQGLRQAVPVIKGRKKHQPQKLTPSLDRSIPVAHKS